MQRCAVYTRKSTEDGLEQEFNSLDAQYEACAAYALSQRHEGWSVVPDRYDDGGFSGGSMKRPGLKRLLADIAAGKVDIILVYKIDRLTRSLADFAKIVEVLDKAGASFVSITQSFNTTTSMGRLTLNMLLSFAQFEREVTGERIRDKIAASKRKGMWMGGSVPVGYRVEDRKLIVEESQATIVRHIMNRYLALGSVVELVDELERGGYATEVKTSAAGKTRGGVLYSRGMLYRVLTNPVYRGMISHKGQTYPGEHAPVVSEDLWDKVQAAMAERTQGHSRRMKAKDPSLLAGLLFDIEGRAMSPSHTLKGKVRYRYYSTRSELVDGGLAFRVSAYDVERLVCDRLAAFLDEGTLLAERLRGHASTTRQMAKVLDDAVHHAQALRNGRASIRMALLLKLVDRVELGMESLVIRSSNARLAALFGLDAEANAEPEPFDLTCGSTKVWHGRQLRLVIPGPEATGQLDHRDPKLINLMREAHAAQRLAIANPDMTISALARMSGRCRNRMARYLAISSIAPDIVGAILQGRQPIGFSITQLMQVDLPLCWREQRLLLGFA
jgi:site-specific DNA recombinase